MTEDVARAVSATVTKTAFQYGGENEVTEPTLFLQTSSTSAPYLSLTALSIGFQINPASSPCQLNLPPFLILTRTPGSRSPVSAARRSARSSEPQPGPPPRQRSDKSAAPHGPAAPGPTHLLWSGRWWSAGRSRPPSASLGPWSGAWGRTGRCGGRRRWRCHSSAWRRTCNGRTTWRGRAGPLRAPGGGGAELRRAALRGRGAAPWPGRAAWARCAREASGLHGGPAPRVGFGSRRTELGLGDATGPPASSPRRGASPRLDSARPPLPVPSRRSRARPPAMADPAPPPQRFSEGFPGRRPHGAPHCGCATARRAHRSRDAAHYDKGAPGPRHVTGEWLRPFCRRAGRPLAERRRWSVTAAPRHGPRGRRRASAVPCAAVRAMKTLKETLSALRGKRPRLEMSRGNKNGWATVSERHTGVRCVRRSDGGRERKHISNGLVSEGRVVRGLLGCSRNRD